jgi:hypothetical protein
MKNQQNNTSALSALLRTANGGDTLETNSLCCTAAGIIAPPSATAEAPIPHEELRGAALAVATLNAQKRPLAQPALGYMKARDPRLNFEKTNRPSTPFHLCQRLNCKDSYNAENKAVRNG